MKFIFPILLLCYVFAQLGCKPDQSVDMIAEPPKGLFSIDIGDGSTVSASGALAEAWRLSTNNDVKIVFMSKDSISDQIIVEGRSGCGFSLPDLPVIEITRQGLIKSGRESSLELLLDFSNQWRRSANFAGVKFDLIVTAEEGVPGTRLVEVLSALVSSGSSYISAQAPQEESGDEQKGEVSAEARGDFETGLVEMKKGGDDNLDYARECFLRVIKQYQEQGLVPHAYLNLGRISVKREKWKDGLQYFGKIIKTKKWLDRQERAEANFSYGLCFDQIGKTDEAIYVYHNVFIVYGSYVDWSSQAVERGFELAYSKEGQEAKIRAYTYLRMVLYMLQMGREEDAPSGALGRIRRRLPEVIKELGLTSEQLLEIDRELGILPPVEDE